MKESARRKANPPEKRQTKAKSIVGGTGAYLGGSILRGALEPLMGGTEQAMYDAVAAERKFSLAESRAIAKKLSPHAHVVFSSKPGAAYALQTNSGLMRFALDYGQRPNVVANYGPHAVYDKLAADFGVKPEDIRFAHKNNKSLVVLHPSMSTPGILVHELTHTNLGPGAAATAKEVGLILGRVVGKSKVPLLMAATHSDSKASQYSVLTALLAELPQLVEEGRANLGAVRGTKKLGLGSVSAARRSATVSMKSYLAAAGAGVGTTLAVRGLRKSWDARHGGRPTKVKGHIRTRKGKTTYVKGHDRKNSKRKVAMSTLNKGTTMSKDKKKGLPHPAKAGLLGGAIGGIAGGSAAGMSAAVDTAVGRMANGGKPLTPAQLQALGKKAIKRIGKKSATGAGLGAGIAYLAQVAANKKDKEKSASKARKAWKGVKRWAGHVRGVDEAGKSVKDYERMAKNAPDTFKGRIDASDARVRASMLKMDRDAARNDLALGSAVTGGATLAGASILSSRKKDKTAAKRRVRPNRFGAKALLGTGLLTVAYLARKQRATEKGAKKKGTAAERFARSRNLLKKEKTAGLPSHLKNLVKEHGYIAALQKSGPEARKMLVKNRAGSKPAVQKAFKENTEKFRELHGKPANYKNLVKARNVSIKRKLLGKAQGGSGNPSYRPNKNPSKNGWWPTEDRLYPPKGGKDTPNRRGALKYRKALMKAQAKK